MKWWTQYLCVLGGFDVALAYPVGRDQSCWSEGE